MRILGSTTVSVGAAQEWARQRGAHQRFIEVIPLYFEICPRYNIPAENGIGQASHETNDGKYTGVLSPDFHNWCGLKTSKGGANEDPEAHQRFPDDRTGVLAHIQHLARYGGAQGVAEGDTLVDPRWSHVTKFTDTIEGLGGSWAPSPTYGTRVRDRIQSLISFAAGFEEPMTAQIPGFTWEPAELDHYHGGRTARIRGGAQHYTAGTNSLPWLTKTSNPPVSATFLVRNKPTLEDRGWQLIRIEDTAWTTAFANPYTVSVEYEHNGHDPIPDVAYTVLAQTWIDIAGYVSAHDLGSIPLNRNGIRGHKEWVGNAALTCPDGIDINRIVAEIDRLLNVKPPEDALVIAGNPFGEIPIVSGFKGLFLETGKVKYPDDPIAGAVSLYGYPEGPEYPTTFGSAQVFERAVFKWHRGAQRPWDLVIAHRAEPVPEAA